MFLPSLAQADLNYCNQRDDDIYTTFTWGGPPVPMCYNTSRPWYSEGWYYIPAHTCTTVWSGSFCGVFGTNCVWTDMFLYGFNAARTTYWSGETIAISSSSGSFDEGPDPNPRSTCFPYTGFGFCGGLGGCGCNPSKYMCAVQTHLNFLSSMNFYSNVTIAFAY